jgi:uncharacterized membrane protein HdeD (DUF308 family)
VDAIVRTLSQNWWLVVLQGVLSVVLGILAVVWPGITLGVVLVLWGLFTLLNGVVDVFAAIGAVGSHLRNRARPDHLVIAFRVHSLRGHIAGSLVPPGPTPTF